MIPSSSSDWLRMRLAGDADPVESSDTCQTPPNAMEWAGFCPSVSASKLHVYVFPAAGSLTVAAPPEGAAPSAPATAQPRKSTARVRPEAPPILLIHPP